MCFLTIIFEISKRKCFGYLPSTSELHQTISIILQMGTKFSQNRSQKITPILIFYVSSSAIPGSLHLGLCVSRASNHRLQTSGIPSSALENSQEIDWPRFRCQSHVDFDFQDLRLRCKELHLVGWTVDMTKNWQNVCQTANFLYLFAYVLKFSGTKFSTKFGPELP